MTRIIITMYDCPHNAYEAIRHLLHAGFKDKNIGLAVRDADHLDVAKLKKSGLQVMTGYVDTIGRVIAAGPMMGMFNMKLGTSPLKNIGLDVRQTYRFAQRLRQDNIVIALKTHPSNVDYALRILRHYGHHPAKI